MEGKQESRRRLVHRMYAVREKSQRSSVRCPFWARAGLMRRASPVVGLGAVNGPYELARDPGAEGPPIHPPRDCGQAASNGWDGQLGLSQLALSCIGLAHGKSQRSSDELAPRPVACSLLALNDDVVGQLDDKPHGVIMPQAVGPRNCARTCLVRERRCRGRGVRGCGASCASRRSMTRPSRRRTRGGGRGARQSLRCQVSLDLGEG